MLINKILNKNLVCGSGTKRNVLFNSDDPVTILRRPFYFDLREGFPRYISHMTPYT